MAVILDEATRAEYLAQTLASSRASLVVSALTGTVTCEVYDGANTLRASGTMTPPWATSSGSTITVGEVNASGISVTSGGAPDSNWYCQFRGANGRFVRGTFGVSTGTTDFKWSLASFQTGSRGTLGTVTMAAQGAPDTTGSLVVISAPAIAAFSGVATAAGSLLRVTPTGYQSDPPVVRQGTVGAFTASTLTLDANASSAPGAYVGAWVSVANPSTGFATPHAIITGYNETLKTISFATGALSGIAVGQTWKIVREYPVVRSWQWYRNGAPISGAISSTYTTEAADVGASITVVETGGTISTGNDGTEYEAPGNLTTSVSAAIVPSGSVPARRLYQSHIAYAGTFKAPSAGVSGNRTLPFFSGKSITIGTTGAAASLIVRGHVYTGCVAEISAAGATASSGTYDTLPTASLIYPASASTNLPLLEGGRTLQGVTSGNDFEWRMLRIANGKMLFSHTSWLSHSIGLHYRRPADLTDQTAASVEGPFTVYDPTYQTNPRWGVGWYCAVPTEWQSALGGDVISMQGGSYYSIGINERNSHGPSAVCFNSADIDGALAKRTTGTALAVSGLTIRFDSGASATDGYYVGHYVYTPQLGYAARITAYTGATRTATVDAWPGGTPTAGATYFTIPPVYGRQLVGYAPSDPLQASLEGYGNFLPVWNFGASIGGCCIPDGTDTLLVFVQIGDGRYNYHQTAISNSENAGMRIYDPYNAGPGPKTYPNFYKVYAYDLNELAAVKSGARSFNSVRPYGVFTLDLPDNLSTGIRGSIGGVAYDSTTQSLYLADTLGVYSSLVIHKFAVTVPSSAAVQQIDAPYIYVYPQDSGATTTNLGLTPRADSVTATPAVGSTLVCHFGNYTRDLLDPVSADNHHYPLIRSYQWYRNGVAISGQNTQCYTPVAADAGQSITCRETVYEPRGTVAAQFSAFPSSPTATYTFSTAPVVPTGTRSSSLVYQDDIEYLGSFLPPNHADLTFYSGYGLAWNAAGDEGRGSLFMLSKDGAAGQTVEFAIPTIAPRATIGDCPYATALQGPTDAREGWTSPVTALGDTIMAGQLVYGGRLLQTVATTYSFAAQPRSHASRPLNLSTTGDVKWAKVVDTSRSLTSGRTFGGAMCHVPPAWQSALGGPVLTGMTSLSVVGNGSSDGPCSAAFDPAEINNNTVEAETLTRYTGGEFNNDGSDLVNSAGGYFGQPHPLWYQGQMNYSEHAMVIPFGTDSLLYIGERGEGSYEYGPGDSFHNGGAPGGNPVTVRGVPNTYMRIYDPQNPYTPGPHAYPYTTGVYAFRLADLAAVKSGAKSPGQVRPYGVWGMQFPFTGQGTTRVRSSAYDPAGRRLFVAQWAAGQIAIHVYRINNAVAV